MTDSIDSLLSGVERTTLPPPAGSVPTWDNTPAPGTTPAGDRLFDSSLIDNLFNRLPSYKKWKREQPWHRLALWMLLRGQTVLEVATSLRKTPHTVYMLRKEPWFQEAFCSLSQEMGKEPVQALLAGEVLQAVERTVELAKTAETHAVRLAANKEILDRFLGKATVKIDQKVSGTVNNVVYDAAKLLKEERELSEQLKAKGIGGVN